MAVQLTTPGRARRGWVNFGEVVLIFTRQGHISQVSTRARCDGQGKAMIGLWSDKIISEDEITYIFIKVKFLEGCGHAKL